MLRSLLVFRCNIRPFVEGDKCCDVPFDTVTCDWSTVIQARAFSLWRNCYILRTCTACVAILFRQVSSKPLHSTAGICPRLQETVGRDLLFHKQLNFSFSHLLFNIMTIRFVLLLINDQENVGGCCYLSRRMFLNGVSSAWSWNVLWSFCLSFLWKNNS